MRESRWCAWIYGLIVFVSILLLASLARAQTPPDHRDLLPKLAAKVGAPSNLDDASRASFTYKVAQQLNFSAPGEGVWCQVRNANGNASADKIILKGSTTAADLMTGTAGSAEVIFQWAFIDASGTSCIEAPAHDWLATAPPPPQEPPIEPPATDSLPALLLRLESRLAALEASVRAIPPCSVTAPPLTLPVFDLSLGVPFIGTAKGTATPRK